MTTGLLALRTRSWSNSSGTKTPFFYQYEKEGQHTCSKIVLLRRANSLDELCHKMT